MTLIYSMIIFIVIWFNVYYDYMLSIVRLSLYSSMESYSGHSMVPWVSGKHSVSMVLIPCFPVIAPYILGHVVDRGGDTPNESFVVHSPNVGLVELYYYGRLALFLIFLSNVHHV
jgi:hypothetical protein